MPTNAVAQPDFTRLQAFRQQVYQLFHRCRDALFELLDAIVQTPAAHSFAELSLAAARQRGWASQYKALSRATYDRERLNETCLAQIPARGPAHFALDVMAVRRMRSPTLKDRQYCHGAQREVGGRGIIIGLPYSILAWVERRASSWALPVHQQRLRPAESPVAVAVEQVRWLAANAPPTVEPRVALDGAYGNRQFFAGVQGESVAVVARLRKDRVLYRRPDPRSYKGRGRRAVYGAPFRCADPATWGAPDECITFTDPRHGQVRLELWRDLGLRYQGQFIAVDVIRSRIHTTRKEPPAPHWYAAYNGTGQTINARQWYETIVRRWPIEPANRFRKEHLFAELPKVRRAEASDTWLLLGQLAAWELYLARTPVAQHCLPWQQPQAADQLTPGRVKQSVTRHFSHVGTPVSEVRPRGNAPGWPAGRARRRPAQYRLEPKRRKQPVRVSKNE